MLTMGDVLAFRNHVASKVNKETQEESHLSLGTVGQHPNARVIHNIAEMDAVEVMQDRWGRLRALLVQSMFAYK